MILAVFIGALSGIISGMGIGGGTILIPALSIFLNVSQHNAQGVNLLYFIPTAAIALVVHFKNKSLNFKIAIPIIFSGILGAAAGASLAKMISAETLKKFFAIFLFAMGLYEIFGKKKKQ